MPRKSVRRSLGAPASLPALTRKEEKEPARMPALPGRRIAILLLMKTAQMTPDDSLVEAVDRAAESLGTTRSASTRDALRAALTSLQERALGVRHRAGYERKPVQPGECNDWENEQAWDD